MIILNDGRKIGDHAGVMAMRDVRDGSVARRSPEAPGPGLTGLVTYGSLRTPLPSNQELTELRRQQAALHQLTGKLELDPQNLWLAIGALAAPFSFLGLEAAPGLAARLRPSDGRGPGLNLTQREPFLRVGDNYATRAGRRAHQALKEKAEAKPGWDYEAPLPRSGARPLKPDVSAPARNPTQPRQRFQMELKPNTPSGRRAAARAVQKYESQRPKNKTRAIYYDPEDYA